MSAFTEANRKAFNDLSATYNTKPWQHKISQQVSDALQQRKDWLGVPWIKPDDADDKGRDVRLLDYACGTGAITKALGPSVTTIRGIDISESMVEKYNEAALSSGLTSEQAHAVAGDLFDAQVAPQLSGPEFQFFDIAVIGLGFHHFEDPALAIKRLAERLKPETGVLVIIDFLPFADEVAREQHQHQHSHGHENAHSAGEGGASEMAHTIKHTGFKRENMAKLFADGGLEGFGWSVLDEPAVMEMESGRKERGVFIAKGRRSATAWGKLRGWFGGLQEVMGGQMGMMRPDGRYVE
ncbi:hypothetical protein LTR12_000448 [Friedmanniomyces endolithicus]|nr:hypothetical protein LTR74_013657 [Friedmanniomyces endolithicus]KAK1825159.1 hypothetical protein LTR12_000448 [Friedmanniomyces endolithicus]